MTEQSAPQSFISAEEQLELERKVRLLNILAASGVVVSLIFLAAMLYPPISPAPYFVIFGLLLAICLASMVLNRLGYSRPAAHVFLLAVTLAIFAVLLVGLLREQLVGFVIFFFPLPVLSAGMLLGSRSTFGYATLNAILIAVIGAVASQVPALQGAVFVTEVFSIVVPAIVLCYLMALVAWLYGRSQEQAWRELTQRSQQLQAANEEIRAFSRTLEDKVEERTGELRKFVSMVAHDLRNPLATIQGYVELMREQEMGTLQERQRETLDTIASNVEHIVHLTDDLLEISFLQSGGIQFDMKPVPIEGVIQEVCDSYEQRLSEKRLGLKLELPSELPPVWGDSFHLTRALNNLVGNAYNYTPSGAIILGARPLDSYVEVSVADTGIGISAEEHKHLFTHFFRGGHKVVRNQKGTGLGLAIARYIVEAHGGEIWAESERDKGTTFRLTIPMAEQANGLGQPPVAAI